MSRPWLLALLFALPLLAGCMGGRAAPVAIDELVLLREQFEELDRAGREEINSRLTTLQQELSQVAQSKDRRQREEADRKRLLIGYCWERRGDFVDAQRSYAEASGGAYGSVAIFRSAQVAGYRAAQAEAESRDPETEPARRQEAVEIAQAERNRAVQSLERASNSSVGSRVLVREPPVASLPLQAWEMADLRYQAHERLDQYYRSRTSYQVMATLVRICGGGREAGDSPKKSYPYVLAIVLIAALAKLITTPLTAAQFKSMRAMQAVQPELKKLQEKHKGDKQQMARAQMELFKEHKVNPASSCLPMLIQLPILWWVYDALRRFAFQFWGVRFLYLPSLADPDAMPGAPAWPGPLLILYGISMYFSQKLLATPTATPEQRQQQKMMTIFMPVMLVVMFKAYGWSAAFVLYWLLQNILMTGHQWLIMRPQRLAESVAAAAPPTGSPPEVIKKLAQGGKPSKKKRKR